MLISLIAAMDREGGIGKEGKIPWHLRTDLQRFMRLTIGHTIIMGRKTFLSIGSPLSGRFNIVISRQRDFHYPGIRTVHSLDQALAIAEKRKEFAEKFVIGGGEIYTQALPLASRLYLTRVDTVAGCDVFFPPFDPADWLEVKHIEIPADEKNEFASTFSIFERKSPLPNPQLPNS